MDYYVMEKHDAKLKYAKISIPLFPSIYFNIEKY